MKKTLIAVILFFTSLLCGNAQYAYSLYFMNEMSQRHEYNPAFVPEYGYFALPIIGNTQVGATSDVGILNFLFPYKNKQVLFLHPSVNTADFLNKLQPLNRVKQSLSTDLFSCGFFTSNNDFWTIGLSLKENTSAVLPKSLFEFAKDSTKNYYDLSDMRAKSVCWLEASLGCSKEINDRLRVGLKVKLLTGMSEEIIKYSKLDLTRVGDQWHVNASGQTSIASNFLSYKVDSTDHFTFQDYTFNKHNIKPAGFGAAIDLGFSYRITPDLTLSSSLTDLGFISWNPSSVKIGEAKNGYDITGVSDSATYSYGTWNNQIWWLGQNGKQILAYKRLTTKRRYTDMLTATLRTGLEYDVLKNGNKRISLGLLNTIYYGEYDSDFETVGSVNVRPNSWSCFTATCAFLQKDPHRFGLAMNLSPKWINFFIASDFLLPRLNSDFLPKNAFTFNVQTGIAISLFLNKSPYRYKYKDYPY
ncbi:MAG: DUF5723 family protein [Bacteroidota bacterium]|nr:DUF5723 family protein [Bacteroidota bacterium]